MSELWKEDPEAFIVLRLQESSDPDSAHKAFQDVLRRRADLLAALEAIAEGRWNVVRTDGKTHHVPPDSTGVRSFARAAIAAAHQASPASKDGGKAGDLTPAAAHQGEGT